MAGGLIYCQLDYRCCGVSGAADTSTNAPCQGMFTCGEPCLLALLSAVPTCLSLPRMRLHMLRIVVFSMSIKKLRVHLPRPRAAECSSCLALASSLLQGTVNLCGSVQPSGSTAMSMLMTTSASAQHPCCQRYKFPRIVLNFNCTSLMWQAPNPIQWTLLSSGAQALPVLGLLTASWGGCSLMFGG